MPIPEEHGKAPLAIAICGPVARIALRRPMLIDLLKHKIREQLGAD
jgi:hypothetical protein